MILIFGGAYQGKLTYALERFGGGEDSIYRCRGDSAEMPQNRIIYGVDKWILALIRANLDIEESVGRFIDANRDAVVICDDISCGVVPVDAELRHWRDAVGRSLTAFAGESEEVIRLFCGIPSKLK